jgi:hypothetical protein
MTWWITYWKNTDVALYIAMVISCESTGVTLDPLFSVFKIPNKHLVAILFWNVYSTLL